MRYEHKNGISRITDEVTKLAYRPGTDTLGKELSNLLIEKIYSTLVFKINAAEWVQTFEGHQKQHYGWCSIASAHDGFSGLLVTNDAGMSGTIGTDQASARNLIVLASIVDSIPIEDIAVWEGQILLNKRVFRNFCYYPYIARLTFNKADGSSLPIGAITDKVNSIECLWNMADELHQCQATKRKLIKQIDDGEMVPDAGETKTSMKRAVVAAHTLSFMDIKQRIITELAL